jgi:flagellar protein FliL
MSDEAPAPEAAKSDAKPAKSGGGGGKLGMIFGLLNLGATGFLVFKTLTAPPPAPAAEHGDQAAEHAPKKRRPVAGPIAPMDAFVVNLRDEGVSRYLKTSFELELDSPESLKELEDAKRAVRDDVLRFLSNLSVAETLGEEGKQTIQDGIVARLDRQLGPGRVKKFYFTDFVIQ